MKLELSVYGVSDLTRKLRQLESDLEDANIVIVNKLVDDGKKIAENLNARAEKSGDKDNDIIPVHSTVSENGKAKGAIIMQGPNAVYDEFGTGERGADDGHPWKYMFSLNPYNSGPIVSKNINSKGRHYWFYRGYTEGIPSGKQMYTTAQILQKEKHKVASQVLKPYLRRYK